MEFFDRNGAPSIYTEDGEHLYTWGGEPVAYFHEGSVYAFGGKHLGWFEDGWILDPQGNRMLFTEDAVGGPFLPFLQFTPFKAFKQFLPFKAFRAHEPYRPAANITWVDSIF